MRVNYSVVFAVLTLVTTAIPGRAALKAGAAQVDITPPLGLDMPAWRRQADGVRDPLLARALVLDDGETRLAIVSLDICMIVDVVVPSFHDGPEYKNLGRVAAIRREIQARTGIDKVICVASHTHSSAGKASDEWMREEERRIVNVVTEAADHTRAATIGAGWGTVNEGFNRRIPQPDGTVTTQWDNPSRKATGPVDHNVGIIAVRGEDGTAIATLVNFACHAVVLGPENTKYSADYPGALAKKVETAVGGQCLFLQGAAGDTDPYVGLLSERTGADAEIERLGSVLAQEVVAALARIPAGDSAPRLAWKTELVPLAGRREPRNAERKIQAEINTILIGPEIALATFPGEFFAEHGLTLKRLSPVKNTLFIGYCNGFLGYFPTIKASMEGGYGAVWRWWAQTEIGAGETLVNTAVINLGLQAKVFDKAEATTVMPKR